MIVDGICINSLLYLIMDVIEYIRFLYLIVFCDVTQFGIFCILYSLISIFSNFSTRVRYAFVSYSKLLTPQIQNL
jgi:hypothetical protein